MSALSAQPPTCPPPPLPLPLSLPLPSPSSSSSSSTSASASISTLPYAPVRTHAATTAVAPSSRSQAKHRQARRKTRIFAIKTQEHRTSKLAKHEVDAILNEWLANGQIVRQAIPKSSIDRPCIGSFFIILDAPKKIDDGFTWKKTKDFSQNFNGVSYNFYSNPSLNIQRRRYTTKNVTLVHYVPIFSQSETSVSHSSPESQKASVSNLPTIPTFSPLPPSLVDLTNVSLAAYHQLFMNPFLPQWNGPWPALYVPHIPARLPLMPEPVFEAKQPTFITPDK